MIGESMQLHERLKFDLDAGQVLDTDRRYIILRADVLMGAFDRLDEPSRSHALEALGESVTRFGSNSVRAYRAEVGASALLDAIISGSASLGWGRWSFVEEGERLWLEVFNSPFAASTSNRDRPACDAIVGMLRAVGLALWGDKKPVYARELACACMQSDASARCRFLAESVPKLPPNVESVNE